jgi:biopolymer transport protein ExbB
MRRWCKAAAVVMAATFVLSQGASAAGPETDASAVARAEEALHVPEDPVVPATVAAKAMSYLELFLAGGPLMWPILVMSLVALTFSIERAIAVRRSRFVPRSFIDQFEVLRKQNPLDIPQLRRLCDDNDSVVARIVRVIVDKLGRPLAEVERAVSEAKDREATKLYANVRPISLAASITPLIGLLGTVQGMILAFHTTANMGAGADRASELAGGIYVALLTTFAGLCVAIPAAVIAHWLEGRIMRGFRDVDAAMSKLWRLVEKCENAQRIPVSSQAQAAARGGQAAVP